LNSRKSYHIDFCTDKSICALSKFYSLSCSMKEISKIKRLYELKHVFRDNDVRGKLETSAEHSRSCLILADYFMNSMDLKIDKLKVYELLMYHDLVEIEAWDVALNSSASRAEKKAKELSAMKKIMTEMPEILQGKYEHLFYEFEEKKTLEARFANAIDKLDADIYAIDSTPKSFEWYSEKLFREMKQHHYTEFPEINAMFEKILISYKERGVI